ncbi:hypothetical protein L195_g025429, partial [Trifolium pratense]
KLAESSTPQDVVSPPKVVRREKKIAFADEAGGRLCQGSVKDCCCLTPYNKVVGAAVVEIQIYGSNVVTRDRLEIHNTFGSDQGEFWAPTLGDLNLT